MTENPFSVLEDDRVARVLERLHNEADKQTGRLIRHYVPKIPKLLLGRPLRFKESEFGDFYADKYIALERPQAAFCYLTARALQAQRIVEFGTSLGISTIWLAAAVRANGGGQVIGTELIPEKAERARQHIEEAGLLDLVDIRVGDATETLRDVPSSVDMLLNDGFPTKACEIVELVAPQMREGGVVLTDNIGTFKANYRDYVRYMRDPANGFLSVTVPFKSGTEYSVRIGH